MQPKPTKFYRQIDPVISKRANNIIQKINTEQMLDSLTQLFVSFAKFQKEDPKFQKQQFRTKYLRFFKDPILYDFSRETGYDYTEFEDFIIVWTDWLQKTKIKLYRNSPTNTQPIKVQQMQAPGMLPQNKAHVEVPKQKQAQRQQNYLSSTTPAQRQAFDKLTSEFKARQAQAARKNQIKKLQQQQQLQQQQLQQQLQQQQLQQQQQKSQQQQKQIKPTSTSASKQSAIYDKAVKTYNENKNQVIRRYEQQQRQQQLQSQSTGHNQLPSQIPKPRTIPQQISQTQQHQQIPQNYPTAQIQPKVYQNNQMIDQNEQRRREALSAQKMKNQAFQVQRTRQTPMQGQIQAQQQYPHNHKRSTSPVQIKPPPPSNNTNQVLGTNRNVNPNKSPAHISTNQQPQQPEQSNPYYMNTKQPSRQQQIKKIIIKICQCYEYPEKRFKTYSEIKSEIEDLRTLEEKILINKK